MFLNDNENGEFLIECSPDFRLQTINNNINDFENIFISHAHADRIMGLWELTKIAKINQKTIFVYSSKEILDTIKIRFPFMFTETFKEMGSGSVVLKEFIAKEKINPENTNISITPLHFMHKNENCNGFKYKNFVFTSDVESIPQETEEYLYNLDLWILECNNLEEKNNGHNYLK